MIPQNVVDASCGGVVRASCAFHAAMRTRSKRHMSSVYHSRLRQIPSEDFEEPCEPLGTSGWASPRFDPMQEEKSDTTNRVQVVPLLSTRCAIDTASSRQAYPAIFTLARMWLMPATWVSKGLGIEQITSKELAQRDLSMQEGESSDDFSNQGYFACLGQSSGDELDFYARLREAAVCV